MATITSSDSTVKANRPTILSDALSIIKIFASLRLTVALFAAGIFIIFYGTLAQVEKDMWDVIAEYFRAKWSWIEIRLLFPPSFFPRNIAVFKALQDLPSEVGFPFLGGWTIGLLLALNLVAAHLFRFKLQAKGSRLWLGLVVFALGVFFTWMICGGAMQRSAGIQGMPILEWATLWQVVKVLVVVAWIASIVKLVQMERDFTAVWYAMLAGCVALGALVLYLLIGGDAARPTDPSIRILWQLIQGTMAGLILLVACIMLFKKRGGIVVIHLGVALMMFGELLVGLIAVEEQIQIPEGRTVNFARDLRKIELAVVDSLAADKDAVVAIPDSLLVDGADIKHPALPFDVHIVKRYDNANLASPSAENTENLATAGNGLQLVAERAQGASGADTSGAVDMATVYATLTPKHEGDLAKNTYLFCQQFGDGELTIGEDRPEAITVGDKTYHVALRFKRTYKPYSIRLIDISKSDYVGTDTPRDYSSYVHMVDTANSFDRDDIRIWMNNPLRYGGETFYQSNYSPPGAGRPETTTLSVVANTGWMIPYVACMLAFVGMLAHFGMTLLRFLNRMQRADTFDDNDTTANRRERKRRRGSPALEDASPRWGLASLVIPVVMIGFVMLFVVSKAAPRKSDDGEFNIAMFGKTPVVFEGRAKPIDTLARNALQRISNKQVVIGDDGEKTSATQWLLDVMSQSDAAERHQVFRIENEDVRQRLGLEGKRKGLRFALSEFRDKVFDGYAYNDEYANDIRKVREAAQKDMSQLSTYQRKLLEFDTRLSQYRRLADSFKPLDFPASPTAEDVKNDPEGTQKTIEQIQQLMVAVPKMDEFLKQQNPPLVVPNFSDETSDSDWQCYAAAVNRAYVKRIFMGGDVDEGVLTWTKILGAYANNDALEFNKQVSDYQKALAATEFDDLNTEKVSFEAFFNELSPFSNATAFYIIALLTTAASWLFSSRTINRAAWWLIFATLLLHTFALGARIYISGRPPVTNLYSSAVFIGWGCVVLGLIFERIFPLGIGNLVSSVCGFSTLLIAHFLAARGDTFTVLQAVLDTQFWLATHVVCVSLGYATTFVAGALGIVSVCAHAFAFGSTERASGGSLERESLARTLGRMIYGTLCFALFFSFIGTVLGGLWADDSWGRFWGWDPKENGALIIVLWNALILHARWGKMIGDRGLAVLAVLGNVTTGWSWFGVNELGIGLHSYGFTDGVVFYLGLFVISQLVIVAVGLLSQRWQSTS